MKKSYVDIATIIGAIAYKRHNDTWKVKLATEPGTERRGEQYYPGDLYLQVVGEEGGERWTGRKWRLSYHMTTSEIVYTAFKAVQAAEEHEMREFFTYKDTPVCHPHLCVEDFVQKWQNKEIVFDVREDAMSGAE